MKIYVATVHYGLKDDLTKRFISELSKLEDFEEIVIANNNSTPLKINQKKVKVINNYKNLGWGGGINSTLPYILEKNPDYIFIVNNDCFPSHKSLRKMAETLSNNEKIGIGSPVLQYIQDNRTYFDMGGVIDKDTGFALHKNASSLNTKLKPFEIDFSGTILVKRKVIEEIKGFDEDFFLFMEDVDFCLRAKRAGFSTYLFPQSVYKHLLSETVGRDSNLAVYHQTKSSFLFFSKYYKTKLKGVMFLFIILYVLTKRFVKSPSTGIYGFLAIGDFLLHNDRQFSHL